MSLNQLETMVWRECQRILENRTMRKKDLLEWSSGEVKAKNWEIVIRLESLGINAVVSSSLDRRKG